MTTTIRKVTIACVRGIRRELELDLEGRSLLLRGDNGSGKSSIAQAMRWALTGAPTGPAEPLPPEFVRHRLEPDPAAARVVIELSPEGRIELAGGKPSGDAAGDAFRNACGRATPFLRRDDLLAVLKDAPGERFKYFESFLDLDRVDELAGSLAARLKVRTEGVRQIERKRDAELASSCARLPADQARPRSASEAIAAFTTWAQRLGISFPAPAALGELAAECSRRIAESEAPETSARRAVLISASDRASKMVVPQHPATVLEPLREAEQRAREAELLPLLQQALVIVESAPSLDTCPVCEQTVVREQLATRLRVRVALLAEVRELEERVPGLADAWRRFVDELERIERDVTGAVVEARPMSNGRALLEHLAAGTVVPETLARLERLRGEIAAKLAELPDEHGLSELRELHAAIVAAMPRIDRLARLEAERAREQTVADALRAVEKAVSGARKDYASSKLQDIGSLVAKYYVAIHPPDASDEATGAPTIVVQRHGAGTARIRGMFNNEQVDDPRLIYSDGHLDTVGLCIFLALRRSRADRAKKGEPKLMVLDDVVMSIDMGHAERFVRVLREDFDDHQIVIFSHNELFMKSCARILCRAKRLHINRWSLEDGPRIVGHVRHVDRLRTEIEDAGEAAQVAHAMTPVLEDLVHEAERAFELAIPWREAPTLGDYWGPLTSKLRELTKKKALPDLSSILRSIDDPVFIRNALGAHDNEWAKDIELRTVQRIATALLELIDALQCPDCKTIKRPKNTRELAEGLRCECREKS